LQPGTSPAAPGTPFNPATSADDGDCPDVRAFDTHANFRNHLGDFCRDSGYFVNNLRIPTKAATYSNLIAATIPI
jgi:hypothetical protein